MGKIKNLVIGLMMILLCTTFVLTGCSQYRKLQVNFDNREVVVFLSDNPEDNLFTLSATVTGNKRKVSTDVTFDILTTQGVIEQYGDVVKDGNKSTITYRALSKGKVDVYVTTVEGEKYDVCTVDVKIPVTEIGFKQEKLLINRGTQKDFANMLKFTPNETSESDVVLSVASVEIIGEDSKIHIDGTKVLVDNTTTLRSFVLQVTSKDRPEISSTIPVDVVDTVNKISIEGHNPGNLENLYAQLDVENGSYVLNLAQNVDDSSRFKRLIRVRGLIQQGAVSSDKGIIKQGNEYQIKILKFDEEEQVYNQIALPYYGDHVEISKQLENGTFQVLQRSKGTEKFRIVVDYVGYEGEFTSQTDLVVNVQGLPTAINVTGPNQNTSNITIFKFKETSTIQGTSVDVEVVGVNNEKLDKEPVLISLVSESGVEIKVNIKNKYGELLTDLTSPITVSNDSPLLISHYYEAGDEIPTDLKMIFKSVNYEKVTTVINLVVNTSDVAMINLPSELRISSENVEGVELPVGYMDSNSEETLFDSRLLTINIGNPNIVEVDQNKLINEGLIVLKPKILGETSLSLLAPNGIESSTITIKVFEELSEDSTIKIFDKTLVSTAKSANVVDIVLKTNGTYKIQYNINNKYTTTTQAGLNDPLITTTSSVFAIVDGSIITNRNVGSGLVTVELVGYDENGEKVRKVTYKFNIVVKAQLVSATPNLYIETIYDRELVLSHENTLARRTIRYTVDPTNASFTADDIKWVVKVGSIIIEPTYIREENVGSGKLITYIFDYNNNFIYIEVNPEDLKAATVYATLSDSSLVFNAICQISQTFNDESGVATTSVNEDVNVTFTLLRPTKVSSIVLNNIKQQSVTLLDGTVSVKNSYTFDTRDMVANEIGTFIAGNEYVVKYSILPANATIQELSVSHSQAASDLEVTVDNVSKQIKIKVNRQLDGETIIYIRSNDSLGSNLVEQQIYLKVANGSLKNPFEIENADDFAKINNSLSSHYKLVSDINLQSLVNYKPIGTLQTPFTGTFNGLNEIVLGNTTAYVQHSIYNFHLTQTQNADPGVEENENYFGMFGYVGETGAVLNVKIVGASMDIMDSVSNKDTYVGVIAGFSKGLIYNSTVTDGSNIEKANAATMFTDSTRSLGINYKALGSYKNIYVGGIVGMLIGTDDVETSFNHISNYISGVTSNFQNNKAYMNIVATTTISTNTMTAGGLVGYNLGGNILNTNNADYDSIVALNTYPGIIMNNDKSIYGGLVGTNFGIIQNYVAKTYVLGQSYVGGMVGVNFGQILNNTVLPTIRGGNYVGGLIAYNVHNSNMNVASLIKSMFPAILNEEEISSTYELIDNTFYDALFTVTGTDVVAHANTLVKNNKVQFIDNNNINFIENIDALSVYNTSIIGDKYVGGLIGGSYDYNASRNLEISKAHYSIEETILNNSVYSYFTVGSSVEFGTDPNVIVRDRNINNYAGETSEEDSRNKYYGDIILTSDVAGGSVGGFIGIANHANIIKAFVNANITVTANNVTQYIGGLIGSIVGSGTNDAIIRIVDSHTNGIINSQNPYTTTTPTTNANIIGSFVGDVTNLAETTFDYSISSYYNGSDVLKFYNVQSSYSLLKQSLATSGYVASGNLTYVNGFTGVNTMHHVERDIYIGIDRLDGANYSYDRFTAINSFYVGFKLRYLENVAGTSMDIATYPSSGEFEKVKELVFTAEDVEKGYHEFANGDKFSFYNLKFSGENTIEYGNIFMIDYTSKKENVDGELVTTDTTWINVKITEVNSSYTFKTYYVGNENAEEDGFGDNVIYQDFGDGDKPAIESSYNWYYNTYEYRNPSGDPRPYKAYNGYPINMKLENTLTVTGSPTVTYDNELRFVADLPPMGIGVEYIEDGNKTFIHDITDGSEILLTLTELDSKYYNSDGTLTTFNNYGTNDKVNLSNQVKRNIQSANTYILSDVIDITALPKFVGSSKLDFRSVNGLVTFGYDSFGNVTMQLLGAGKDQIKITSLYNTDVTYVANLNIISAVTDVNILQNKRGTTEISTLDVVKNVESSFYADINSTFKEVINSRNYNFDLVQRQNLGVRYYFTYNIGTRLSVLFDTPMAGSVEMLYKLNGQSVKEEAIEIDLGSGLETKYIRYVDIASSEVSVFGSEDFSEYSTILAVPYIVLDNENFFKVTINDVEEIANSYVKGASGVAGTFVESNDLIKPLQIKIYNKTFGMQVDKSSVEFAAYIEPIVTVALTTDNFNEELFYVVSNGLKDSGESSADDPAYSKLVTLDNLQVLSYSPDVSLEAQANRRKTYQFKLNVTKVNDIYNTITNNENFTITFYTKDADSNIEFVETINITLLPQPVTNTSILHYPSSEYEEVIIDGVTTFVPKANEVAYNNIIPGYMGLLKINLSPYYANIENVVITSSVVDGKSVTFEQLIYEKNALSDEYKYITAYPQAETFDNGIIALKRSKVESDAYVYDGNIYLRTILPTSVVSGSLFTITVTPYGYSNGELVAYKPRELTLEAISPPGLDITYKGSRFGVVARGTDNVIDITGEGLEDTFIDFDKYTTLSIYNGPTEYGVAGKLRLTKQSDSKYILNVAVDIPQGSTIKLIGYTEKIINDKLYTSRSELTLKVADFVIEKISVENVVDGVYQAILNQTRLLRVQLAEVSYNANIPGIAKKLRNVTEEISTKLNSRNENATWYQRVFNQDGSYNDISLAQGDYGTFVIDVNDSGDMYLRNTVKNTSDIMVAKAIINYSFGSSGSIQLGEPNEFTTPSVAVDESYMIELECQFSFNVMRNTEDETPEPISTAEQFLAMEPGINYILTNDIVLNQYRPIDTEITSLDGNGYVITIAGFDTSVEYDAEGNIATDVSSINLGLFSTVSSATILKNIVLEIVPLGSPYIVEETSNNSTQDLLVDVSNYDSVNFGFIAAENNGIITNAQVVNDRLANEIRNEREAMLDEYYDDSEYSRKTYYSVPNRSISIVKIAAKAGNNNANVAGLVATNNGFITNSRVENITINGLGYVAGIAVRNGGTISSTYYKGANLLNQSSEMIESAGTAGLVVFNEEDATIQYCYTMSREGWSYDYSGQDQDAIDSNMSGGKVKYFDVDVDAGLVTSDHTFIIGESSGQDYIEHRDISGLSITDKNEYTGVYNLNTLTVSDGTNVVDLKTNSTIYQLAMIALLNNSDMFTLRAINSGINVSTDASGFVYENNGTISNSYANMLVKAAHSAGFVFSSGENGMIEDCYSLSSVREDSDAHSPFTGKTFADTSSTYNATTSNISYSHYLNIDQTIKFTDEHDVPYTLIMKDKFYHDGEPATNLEAQELYSYNSFQGYAFNSDFELNVDILRNVWFIPARINTSSYDTYNVLKDNFKHSYYAPNRPELVSANLRTMSVRVLINDYETSTTLQYEYLPSLIIGESIRNPYLVYNAKTFNDYGTMYIKTESGEVNKNYIRFISDITFDGTSLYSIKAETYNTAFAGDIDGNGMTINELKLIAESNLEANQQIDHLGLFGKLYSFRVNDVLNGDGTTYKAIVRNLNINVTSIDGTGVRYVGALAGEMIDAYAFNIRVTAEPGTFVNGQNAVGGVVGKISGNSELVNVNTNISVSATNKNTLSDGLFNVYDGTEDLLKTISYAGGIAGIVDVNGRTNDVKTAQKYARIRKIDVYGSTTISGDIAGGIFGYIGVNSSASDVHFTITNDGSATPRIVSKYSAGGIVGELRGKIERSYIAHSNQEEINEELKANINTTTHNSHVTKAYTRLFNSSSLADSYYVGGIAGMNIGGTISDSYTNVDVINGVSQFAGGVIGMNIGGTIKSVYTTGSVSARYVGGFIGLAINGGMLEFCLPAGTYSLIDLQSEGLKIANIKDIVETKADLSALTINSIVSANVWRAEDLTKVNYDNIGSFLGKIIDLVGYNTEPDGNDTPIISTTSDSSRKMAEVNVFANATKTVNGRVLELNEIGARNSRCSYEISEIQYPTSAADIVEGLRYNKGSYGIVHKTESGNKYYYYSRFKKYGSLRTIEEIILRKVNGVIAKSYETTQVTVAATSGDFVKYDVVKTHMLPNIYKGWSSIYWEGTAVNNIGQADSEQVLPSLIARPNVAVVRVYGVEDLKLMYTLLGSEFVLMNDIDLSGEAWVPVGTDSDPFTGSIHSDYDSSNEYNSWTIKNVSIDSMDGNTVGFVGTASGATFNDFNLHLSGIDIELSPQYEIHVGGLVGLLKDDNPSTLNNVVVFGGVEKTRAEAVSCSATQDDVILGIGTNELNFVGSSEISATNIVSMGGVIGTSYQSNFTDLHAINLHIKAINAEDSSTMAGAMGTELAANAIGGVVGYFVNDKTITIENLTSKNVRIGDSATSNFRQTLYMGGLIGYGNSSYLRNSMATNFTMDEKIAQAVSEKHIYIGGIAGDFSGIAFDAVVINDSKAQFTYEANSDVPGTETYVNKMAIEIASSGTSSDLYMGGAFGRLSKLYTAYDDMPIYIGNIPIRSDENPFGFIEMAGMTATGHYKIPNISNALVADVNVKLTSNMGAKTSYIGGLIGYSNGPIYNAVTYGNIEVSTQNDAYIGGLIAHSSNDFIQNAYSNRNITFVDYSATIHTNSLYVGGAFGLIQNSGNMFSDDSNERTQNIASSGNIVINTILYKSSFVGGSIGKALNLSMETSISNSNIVFGSKTAANKSDDATAYIGGFVGMFEESSISGEKATIIRDSYSTGSIALSSNAYQNGGAGGFVGYIKVLSDKEMYSAPGVLKDSANITNCYSISRIIPVDGAECTVSNEVKQDILQDAVTKGGFVGAIEGFSDILTNCYFNKEIFGKYENSTNELVYKRYNPSILNINLGLGLTLDEMLYNGGTTTMNLNGEVYNRNNEVVTEPGNVYGMQLWNLQNNAYPTLKFYFESWQDNIYAVENPTLAIPTVLNYCYVNQMFDATAQQKYSIVNLLNGNNVIKTINVEPFYDGAGGNIIGYDAVSSINYVSVDIKSVNNPYGIQSSGTEQNPWFISGTADLAQNVSGVYTYDFTNKAVVITDGATLSNSYGANSNTLVNSTIIFKGSATITSAKFATVDVNSFIYGLTTSSSADVGNKITTNYGELKNFNIEKLTSATVFIDANYGLVNDMKVKGYANAAFVTANDGIIDNINYDTLSSITTFGGVFVTGNTGYINGIFFNINALNTIIYDTDGVTQLETMDYSGFGLVGTDTGLSTNYAVAVKLPNRAVGDSSKSIYNMYYIYRGNTLASYATYATVGSSRNMVIESDYRTLLSITNNTKAHAIDAFASAGTTLAVNKNAEYTIPYDFGKHWIIITGINNNMPILRAQIKTNYYDADFADSYYFTESALTGTTFDVGDANTLASVGKLISEAGSGTYTINITANINLATKLWKPINVLSGVTVTFNGGGHEINNISAIAVNNDVGFFGITKGIVTVKDVLFKDGYVAGVGGYAVDSSASDQKVSIYAKYDYDNTNGSTEGERNYAVGSIIGRVFSADDVAVTFNRVGNQYVYVAGKNNGDATSYYVGGLIGISNAKSIGIADSYVNSPFMNSCANMSAGLVNVASTSREVYAYNTYVVNYDTVTGQSSYVSTKVATLTSGSVSYGGKTYTTDVNNYYLNDTNTQDSTKFITGATYDKLKTHILPKFDWAENWVRVQEHNDGLPYNMFEAAYWIAEGSTAVAGTDYTVSSGNYTVLTNKGLAYISYLTNTGTAITGTVTLNSGTTFDMSGKLWSPIAGDATASAFSGTFIGTGAVITNISAANYFGYSGGKVVTTNNNSHIALIAKTNGATIKDVTINKSMFTGESYVASLVAEATNTKINNCVTDADSVVTGNSNVGGIVASLTTDTTASSGSRRKSVVSNVTNNARIFGKSNVGGIVGRMDRTVVEMCTNNAKIQVINAKTADTATNIGGIVGYSNYGSIYETINNGEVVGYDVTYATATTNVGGIVGKFESEAANDNQTQLINALNTATVTGAVDSSTGLIVGYLGNASSTKGNVIMAYSDAVKKIATTDSSAYKYIGNLNEASNGEYWGATSVVNEGGDLIVENSVWSKSGGVLTLNYTTPTDYDGCYVQTNTFEISSATHYQYLNYLIHKRANYLYEQNYDKFDIDVVVDTYSVENKYKDNSAAYTFRGTFQSKTSGSQATFSVGEGGTSSNNHGGLFGVVTDVTIKDIKVTTSSSSYGGSSYSRVGLVAGNAYATDTTRNHFENITVDSAATITGNENVGAIVGVATYSTFKNCVVTTTTVSGTTYVGGFVGSAASLTISGTSTSTHKSSATVSATNYAGGIVGHIHTDSTISGVGYDGASVKATAQWAGGITGYAQNITISSCNVSGSVYATSTSNSYSGGIVGEAKDSTTVSSNTFSGTAHGWQNVAGIVGYKNGATVSGNTVTGTIYVYRDLSSDDTGKKSNTITGLGFSYSIRNNEDVSSKYDMTVGTNTVRHGNINYSNHLSSNSIGYTSGNVDDDASNTVGSSKIIIQDYSSYYTFSYTSHSAHNTGALIGTAYCEITITIVAKMADETTIPKTGDVSYNDDYATKTISDFIQGEDGYHLFDWSGLKYTTAFNAMNGLLSNWVFNFDVAW